jgi:hypothetical protein
MATVPYTLTQADLEFQTNIMMEHCVFMNAGLVEEPYRSQAYEQYQLWQHYIQQGYPEGQLPSLLDELRLLKTSVLDQLVTGRWLGWLSASFMRHILEELEDFALLTRGQRPIPEILALKSYRYMADHLEDAESKTDPAENEFKQQERDLIASTPLAIQQLGHREYDLQQLTLDYQQAVTALAQEQGQPENDIQWMIGLTLRAGERIDRLLGKIETMKPKTVILPALLNHWLAEHAYHEQNLALVLQEFQMIPVPDVTGSS